MTFLACLLPSLNACCLPACLLPSLILMIYETAIGEIYATFGTSRDNRRHINHPVGGGSKNIKTLVCSRNLLHKFVHIVYVTSVAKSSCKISKMIKRQASCMSLMFYICNKILYSKMNSSNPPVN